MEYKEIGLEDLILEINSYNPKTDSKSIKDAFELAVKKLGNKEKEKFKKHLLSTAFVLAELKMDKDTIISALLHHALREGGITKEEIIDRFGKTVGEVVEEYMKITEIEKKNREKIDNKKLGKIILAAAKDIRTVIIKLAAQLSALRNQGVYLLDETKTAKTVNEIYIPIAHKLGLDKIEWELQDLSFKNLNPVEYQKIKQLVGKKRMERQKETDDALKEIERILKEEKINATVYGRPKSFFGIYKKLKRKPFNEIYDLIGIRIICEGVADCYKALSAIHSKYKHIPEKFHDYILKPKENNYKSIHTVIWRKSQPIEIQIRTWEMHEEAEGGLAAHWAYKEFKKDKDFDRKLSWARQLVEWENTAKNANRFFDSIKIDLGTEKIFVFTPKKEVIVLPEKSTPVDFAFAVHTDLGHRIQKAKVNGKIVPLNYLLESGDTVEIITGTVIQTKRQWLNFVKMEKAITKIKQKLGIRLAPKKKKKEVVGKKTSDKAVRIAQCCKPVPGDEIVGYRTTKRKITVHRKDCKNVENLDKGRRTDVAWDVKGDYSVQIRVEAMDRPMLLRDVLEAMASTKSTIKSTNARVDKLNRVTCLFDVEIKNLEQLNEIIKRIKKIRTVQTVERI